MNASERLTQSRERLRQAVLPPTTRPGSADPMRPTRPPPQWLHQLRTAPAARLLVSVWQAWWARQPLRVALTLAAETGAVVLEPIAQKHPFRLVLGAAAAGGVLTWVRPWRWLPTTALLAGVVPALMAEAIKQRASPP